MVPPEADLLDAPDAPAVAPARTTFPVFLPGSARAFSDGPNACPTSIPWRVMERVAERVRLFHGATLEELVTRGGLDPREIQALFSGRRLRIGGPETMHDGVEFLRSIMHGRSPDLEPLREGPRPEPVAGPKQPGPPPRAPAIPELPGYLRQSEAAASAGISAMQLTQWTNRYRWPVPRIEPNGFRYFSVTQVADLKRVAALVAAGPRTVGQIIVDGLPQWEALVEAPAPTPEPPPPPEAEAEPLPAEELAESIPLLRAKTLRERWVDPRNRKLLRRLYYLALTKGGPMSAHNVAREVKVPDHIALMWLNNNYLCVEDCGKAGRHRLWRWKENAAIPPPVEGGPDPGATAPVSEPDPVPPPSAPAETIVAPSAQEPVPAETIPPIGDTIGSNGDTIGSNGDTIGSNGDTTLPDDEYAPDHEPVVFTNAGGAEDPPTDRPVAIYRRSKGSIASGPVTASPDTVAVPKVLLETLLAAIESHRLEHDAWSSGGTRYDQKIAWNRVTAAEQAAQAAMTELMAFAKYGAGLVAGKAPALLPATISWK